VTVTPGTPGAGADWFYSALPESGDDPGSGRTPLPEQVGSYRVLERVGAGGMGTVYRAHHPGVGRDVAIKVLRGGGSSSPRQLKRFETEARAAARLRHPHIVRVYDVGSHRGFPYLVMDLVPGETLADRILRTGPLPLREAAIVARKLARALEHAHERRVLHRDVKPANVLIAPDGEPLLTDFGLAKVLDASTVAGLTGSQDILGTPGYLAPEQGDGAGADERSDVYSLGATLYAMLTGQPPHAADTLLELLARLSEQRVEPPRRLRPDLPPDLEVVCLACLERSPEHRYPSAGDVAADLDRFLTLQPVRGGPRRSPARRAGLRRAGGLVAGFLAGAVLAGGAVGVVLVGAGGETRPSDGGEGEPDVAAAEVAAGRAAKARGDAEAALAAYGRAVAADPASVDARWRRGAARLAAGDAPDALADLDWAVEQAPERAAVWLDRARAHAAAGDVASALGDCARALTLDDGVEGRLLRAELRRAQGDVVGALADLSRAVALGSLEARVARSRLLVEAGRHAEALEDIQAGFAAGRDDAALWGGLARVHRAEGNASGCLDAYGEALKRAPDDLDLRAERARAYLALGRLQDARADFERVVADDPERAVVWVELGNTLRSLGEVAAAVAAFDEALARDPASRPDAWNNRGSCRLELGRAADALADFDRTAALDPDRAEPRVHRGMALRELGRLEDAERACDEALDLDPRSVLALHFRGVVRAQRGRLEPALADLDAAVELAPGDPAVREQRAQVRAAVGTPALQRGAIEDLTRVLEAAPRFANAWHLRGVLHEQLGDREAARRDLERFLRLAPDDARAPDVREILAELREG